MQRLKIIPNWALPQKSGGMFSFSPQSFSSHNESPSISLKPKGPTATPHHPSAPNKSGFRRSWVAWAIRCSHCSHCATSQPRFCHQHQEGVTKQLRKAWSKQKQPGWDGQIFMDFLWLCYLNWDEKLGWNWDFIEIEWVRELYDLRIYLMICFKFCCE